MKKLQLLLVFLLIGTGLSAQEMFRGTLSGEQEFPSVQTTGYGEIEAELDGNTLTLSGNFQNLSSAVAQNISGGLHIHSAPTGSNGPVAIILNAQLDPDGRGGQLLAGDNTFQLSPSETEQLRNRNFYVNLHTEEFPQGELRAQLLPASEKYFQASLSGNQENPAVLSSGNGMVMIEINQDELVLSGSFNGLTSPFDPNVAMGAHIHLGAAGTNGGVEIILDADVDADGLSGVFLPENNSFAIDSSLISLLERRLMYVNIHTEDFQGGEIRGQITGMASSIWRASLSGANEIPTVDSRGYGQVLAEYQAEEDKLTIFGSFNGLESAVDESIAGGAHIHIGLAGQNGPVTRALQLNFTNSEMTSGELTPNQNTFELDSDEVEMLHQRRFYVNIHTADHPGGELRGQLLPLSNYHFNAFAGGSQEVPSVVTSGNGAIKLEWVSGELVVSGSFGDLISPLDPGIAGGAHLHLGIPGENGGVELILNPTLSSDSLSGEFLAAENRFSLDQNIEQAITNRAVYLNIHTKRFQGGEIRGQVLHEAEAYFQANLSGSQEVPSVLSQGSGTLLLERSQDQMNVVGSFGNLNGKFDVNIAGGAHIHDGFAGQNGPILVPLNPTIDSDTLGGTFSALNPIDWNEDLTMDLRERSLYVNIHTSEFPSGEIRGQITGLNSSLFRAHLAGVNEIPAVESHGSGAVIAELDNAGNLTFSGSFNDLESNVAQEIAGGIHLHMGYAGQNGGVELVLNANFEDGKNASFSALDNQFDLSETLLEKVLERATYINVHSDQFPAGEIRGQLLGDAQYVFTSVLSGAQQVPSLVSQGYGMIKGEWSNGRIIFSGYAFNLFEELATQIAGGVHLHSGWPGENGNVELIINSSQEINSLGGVDVQFSPSNNTLEITPELEALITERQTYINIHTDAYESGELRGQLLKEAKGYYFSNLFGSHQFPSLNSPGMGAVQMEWYGDRVEAFGTFSGLSSAVDTSIAGGVHIHTGLPGQNGPLAVLIAPQLDSDGRGGIFRAKDNTLDIDEEFTEAIRNRMFYINVHSLDFPTGEIRGQIAGPSNGILRAYLRGGEENPQVVSTGGGAVLAEMRPDFSTTYYGSFSGLNSDIATEIAGGVHVHVGFPGQNGGVISAIDIQPHSGNRGADIHAQNISLDTLGFLFSARRATYINVHSREFESGEIRGQLLAESQTVYTGLFSALQEVNPVISFANGTVMAEKSGNRLTTVGGLFNLFGEVDMDIAGGAHFHSGLPGQNGDVLYSLNILPLGDNNYLFDPIENILEIDEQAGEMFNNRAIYANVHTDRNPGGEARAQMMQEANNYYLANLGGSNEVPALRTDASGTVILEQYPNRSIAVGGFSGLMSPFNEDVAGGAHIHSALTGNNGPVETLLMATVDPDQRGGIFEASNNVIEVDRNNLEERKLYVNIHTVDNPGGELRATIIPIQIGAFTAHLSGMNEIPPAESPAMGQALVEFNGRTFKISGSFEGLSSPLETNIAGGAHLHIAGPDENGDVAFPITISQLSGDGSSGQIQLMDNITPAEDPDLLTQLYLGEWYFNIHSVDIPSGEIRGQVLPAINFFPGNEATIVDPANGSMLTLEGDPETSFEVSWNSATDDNQLVYLWEVALDPDFEDTIFIINAGTSTQLSFTFQDISSILAENGVVVGQTVELFHRAIASDGSLRTPSEPSSLEITRGVLTNTDGFEISETGVEIYPNPIRSGAVPTVEVNSPVDQTIQLEIMDVNGRVFHRQTHQLNPGSNQIQPQIDIQSSGIFFISLSNENKRSEIRRFTVID